MLLPLGIWVNETIVLDAKATLQTPEATPSVTVQLMPAGALVIVPLPRDAGDGRTVSVAGIDATNPAPTAVVAPELTMIVVVESWPHMLAPTEITTKLMKKLSTEFIRLKRKKPIAASTKPVRTMA